MLRYITIFIILTILGIFYEKYKLKYENLCTRTDYELSKIIKWLSSSNSSFLIRNQKIRKNKKIISENIDNKITKDLKFFLKNENK